MSGLEPSLDSLADASRRYQYAMHRAILCLQTGDFDGYSEWRQRSLGRWRAVLAGQHLLQLDLLETLYSLAGASPVHVQCPLPVSRTGL